MKKRKLIILTTHFGTNFSGGSTATCEIFSRIEGNFEEIIAIGNELGNHPFKNLTFKKYSTWIQALRIVRSFKDENTVFYGDFYNSFIFALLKIDFYFTYHDNWPELRKTSFRNKLLSHFYTTIYTYIFRKARSIFAVSRHKINYLTQYNKNVHLVRNGFNQFTSENPTNDRKDVLMVGNIDDRKYRLALMLFRILNPDLDVNIDIYGNVKNINIAEKLSRFPFVRIMGYSEVVPYSSYKVLIHTSLMENLSIVLCEAVYNELPVIAFNVGGAEDIINSDNGRLIPPYDIKCMKDTLEKIISGEIFFSPDKKVVDEYSWELASKNYLELMTA